MSKKIKMYKCLFPFDVKHLDKRFPSYYSAKKYVMKKKEPCLIYSHKNEIIASYSGEEWYTVH